MSIRQIVAVTAHKSCMDGVDSTSSGIGLPGAAWLAVLTTARDEENQWLIRRAGGANEFLRGCSKNVLLGCSVNAVRGVLGQGVRRYSQLTVLYLCCSSCLVNTRARSCMHVYTWICALLATDFGVV